MLAAVQTGFLVFWSTYGIEGVKLTNRDRRREIGQPLGGSQKILLMQLYGKIGPSCDVNENLIFTLPSDVIIPRPFSSSRVFDSSCFEPDERFKMGALNEPCFKHCVWIRVNKVPHTFDASRCRHINAIVLLWNLNPPFEGLPSTFLPCFPISTIGCKLEASNRKKFESVQRWSNKVPVFDRINRKGIVLTYWTMFFVWVKITWLCPYIESNIYRAIVSTRVLVTNEHFRTRYFGLPICSRKVQRIPVLRFYYPYCRPRVVSGSVSQVPEKVSTPSGYDLPLQVAITTRRRKEYTVTKEED